MQYEENTKWSTRKSWFVVFAISGTLLAWAMTMMTLVESVPREWEFGNIEFTPAKSEYSTHNPDAKTDENQIAPLPDGVSMEEQNKKNNNENE